MARYIVMEYVHENTDGNYTSGTALVQTRAKFLNGPRSVNSNHNRAAKVALQLHGRWNSLETRPIGVMHTTMNGNMTKFVAFPFIRRNVMPLDIQ